MNQFVFYIAEDGSDRWSGQLPEPNANGTDGPFATLRRARDAVRALKAAGQFTRPVSIMVRGGTYQLSEPFRLEPQDSGHENMPILYGAYPGETPVLSGGQNITGWQTNGDGLWHAAIPTMANRNDWMFRQLFVNGARRCRARVPSCNQTHEIAGEIDPTQPLDEEWLAGHSKPNDNHKGFRFKPGQITTEATDPNVELVVIHNFATTRMTISELDEAQGIVRFTGNEYIWSYAPPKRFYLENIKSGLTEPGAWHLDHTAGIVTYRPMPDEDMHTAEVIAPVVEQLILLAGDPSTESFVEHITFSGFVMEHTDWNLPNHGFRDPQAATVISGAILAHGVINCTIKNNELTRIGNYAIEMGQGCRDVHLIANHLHDLGAGGIKIGETINRDHDIDETRHTTVTDNIIHDAGHVFPEGVGIWIGQSSGNRIAHNEIHNLSYTGISVGWNWAFTRNRTRDNRIEHNHIHHVMQGPLDDGGAIYNLGIAPGTTIRNNLIHHVYGNTYAYGIYLDEGTMGVLVENNIIHHFSGAGIRLQIGTGGNIILNNIIALGTIAQFGIDTDRTNAYLCNIIYWKQGKLFTRHAWDGFETVFDHNLYCNASGHHNDNGKSNNVDVDFGQMTFTQWQQQCPRPIRYVKPDPIDTHAMMADPMFMDPENGDFTLSPQSPALLLGFKPIDIQSIGPRHHTRVIHNKKTTQPILGRSHDLKNPIAHSIG